MKLPLVLYLFLIHNGFLYSQEAQQLDYKVFRNSEEVGALSVNRSFTSERVIYSLSSSVKLKAVFTIQVRETIVDEYVHDLLVRSRHQREINDYTSVDKVLMKSGDQYYCDAEVLPHLGHRITHSVLSLYFQEPTHIKLIYSESFQEKVSVSKIKPGVYRLTLPNQKITDYHYENGLLWKVEAHTKWGIITFLRQLPLAANNP